MEPNKLEQEFKNKLEQRTIAPSPMAWDRLDAMLSVGEEKKKPNRTWMYMAASFVLFATIGAFFLTRESGNSNNPKGIGTSVVTTVKEQPGTQKETLEPVGIEPVNESITAPKMQENIVAATQPSEAPSAGKAVHKQAGAPGRVVKDNNHSFMPPVNNEGVATVTHEGFKEDPLKDFEADKLLVASVGNTPKKKASVKVDANSLLSSVEGELDESFREKAFQGAIKSYNAVKTSVANRNYNK